MDEIEMGNPRMDKNDMKLPLFILPNIGLDNDNRQSVVEILNKILANEVVLTLKTRSALWNVCGASYFELHTLFSNQTQQLTDISDEIAERVRVIGGVAVSSLKELVNFTRLEEQPGDIPDVLHLLADHETSIRFLREDAKRCSEEYEDEGTFELLVSVMRRHEKMAWLLRTRVDTEPVRGIANLS
jgi:starvation-inducible DNA-binding protein